MPTETRDPEQLIALLGSLFTQNVIGVSSYNMGTGYDFYQCPACGNVRNATREAKGIAFGPENVTYIRHKESCALFHLYEMVGQYNEAAERRGRARTSAPNRRR